MNYSTLILSCFFSRKKNFLNTHTREEQEVGKILGNISSFGLYLESQAQTDSDMDAAHTLYDKQDGRLLNYAGCVVLHHQESLFVSPFYSFLWENWFKLKEQSNVKWGNFI